MAIEASMAHDVNVWVELIPALSHSVRLVGTISCLIKWPVLCSFWLLP